MAARSESQHLTTADRAALVAQALRTSHRHGAQILRGSRRANLALHRASHSLQRRQQAGSLRLPQLQWPAATAFNAAVAASTRPFILATLHLGNYLHQLLALAPMLSALESVTALRRLAAPELEQRLLEMFAARGLRIRMTHTGRHPARAALQALRRGEHVLLLYDVPPSFDLGRCHEVPWLGQPGRLAAGPAMLARAGDAWLWPLACVPQDRQLQLQTVDPFLVPTRAAERAATRQLAQHAQRWILQAPERWLLWDYLHDFWAPQAASGSGKASA